MKIYKHLLIIAALVGTGIMSTDAMAQENRQQQNNQEENRTTVPAPESSDGSVVDREGTAAEYAEIRYTLNEMIGFDNELNTFEKAYYEAGMQAALVADGPFTIFAPTDAAFLSAMQAEQIEQLMLPEYREQLLALLSNHIVRGNINLADLSNGQKLETISGREITVQKTLSDVRIDGARIITPNIKARNGIMHKVDKPIIHQAR